MKKSSPSENTSPSKPKKPFWYRVIRWTIIWVLLPLVLFYGVIAIWHPEQTYLDKLFNRIENDTGIRITCKEITVTTTFGLMLKNLTVDQVREMTYQVKNQNITVNPRRLFTADSLELSVSWRSLVRAKAGLYYRIACYGGVINGRVETVPFSKTAPMKLAPEWRDISLEKMRQDITDLPLDRGVSYGKADLVFDPENPEDLNGSATITVDNFAFRLPEKIEGALAVDDIEKITGNLVFEGRKYILKEVWARSLNGSIRLTGLVYRESDPNKSRLDIEVRVYPHKPGEEPKENEYLPLIMKGTVSNPQLEFMGMPLDLKSPFMKQ
ncbi:hypothetical protein JW979_12785 [bacterium]|nr:hypothetical protein [candidate division CSSED10-310 bacterium]